MIIICEVYNRSHCYYLHNKYRALRIDLTTISIYVSSFFQLCMFSIGR